ncbi:MAG: hypothetical protein U5N58_05815 [Actinomycetota bacterium]|nr:hypothetical protein [Actinomycetota bacterium]
MKDAPSATIALHQENWHEQNPDDWVSNIIEVISRLFKNITAEDSVAVSSLHGGRHYGASGQVL